MRIPPRSDLAVAALLAVACQAELWLYDGGPSGRAAVTVAAVAVFPWLLAFRRVAPHLTVGLAAFVMVTQTMLGGRMTTTLSLAIAAILIMGSTGLHLPRLQAALWAAVYLAAAWIDVAVATESGVISDLIFTAVLVVGLPTIAGATLRAHREHSAELARLNAQLSAQADQLARAAALEERARIAREMHDVISHSVSLMVVQAGAARHTLRKAPEQAHEALRAVEEVGREAIAELRRTLGVLRDDAIPSERVPPPGVEQIPELIDRANDAGLRVALHETGQPRELIPGTGLAIYRGVQEALTNAARHAPGATVTVTLQWHVDAVEVTVVDDRAGELTEQTSGSGLGLVGMRERIHAYGGQVSAGPRGNARGFEVRALIPTARNGRDR